MVLLSSSLADHKGVASVREQGDVAVATADHLPVHQRKDGRTVVVLKGIVLLLRGLHSGLDIRPEGGPLPPEFHCLGGRWPRRSDLPGQGGQQKEPSSAANGPPAWQSDGR